MRISIGELRILVSESLRGSNSKFVVVTNDQIINFHRLWLDEGVTKGTAIIKNNVMVAGMTLVPYRDDVYIVKTVWASSPLDAVTLFVSTMHYVGRLTPAWSISPAAKSIIKRWYEKHKDDGSIAQSDRYTHDNQPWSGAIYSIPSSVKFSIPFQSQAEDPQQIWEMISKGFRVAYANPRRTKFQSLDVLLKGSNFRGILSTLSRMLDSGDDELRSDAKRWIDQHDVEVRTMMDEDDVEIWDSLIGRHDVS